MDIVGLAGLGAVCGLVVGMTSTGSGALACVLVGLGVYFASRGKLHGAFPIGEATVQSGQP